MNAFGAEREMLDALMASSGFFTRIPQRRWRAMICTELEGYFGVPDLVIGLGRLTPKPVLRSYAFELKLANWSRALEQAYRYAAFVDYSYVVIDAARATPALQNIDRFVVANIGLLTVTTAGQIECVFRAPRNAPYCERLSADWNRHLRATLFESEHPVRRPNNALVLTSLAAGVESGEGRPEKRRLRRSSASARRHVPLP